MFHEMLTSEIYEIIAALIGATISGVILLQIHHSKVKQELEIHQKKDVFDRKQKMYRSFVNNFMALLDVRGNPTHDFANWRVGNYLYNELLFIANDSVIRAFNKYLKYEKTDDPIEFTNITKDVLIAIREDLYGETINRDDINFIRQSRDVDKAFQSINEYYESLEKLNLTNFENFSEIDTKDVAEKTGIPIEKLDFIKKIALNEIRIQSEFTRFLEKEYDNTR